MLVKFTISVEILIKIGINLIKEKTMVRKTKNSRDNVKVVPELGAKLKR